MASSFIFLTQTEIDTEKFKAEIGRSFFQGSAFFNSFKTEQTDEIDYVEKLKNQRRWFEFNGKTKSDFKKEILNFYKSYPQPSLLFLGDLSFYSVPMQEGMLRILEEPPENLSIILQSSDKSKILQTIKSRCEFISIPENWILKNLNQNRLESTKKLFPQPAEVVKNLISNPGSFIIPDLKKAEREDIDFWLWQLNIYGTAFYKKNPDDRIAFLIDRIITARDLNQKNLQKKFALEVLNSSSFSRN